MRRERRLVSLVVPAATGLFAVAIAVRDDVNVWLATGVAGALSAALAWMASGARLRRLLSGSGRDVAWGVGLGGAMALATHAGYALLVAAFPGLDAHVVELYAHLDDAPGRLGAIPVLALVVAAEELVWRGVLVDLEQRRRRGVSLVVVCSLLYALPQLMTGSPLVVAVAAGAGAVWMVERLVFRSLLVPLVTHLTWDLLVFVLVPVT